MSNRSNEKLDDFLQNSPFWARLEPSRLRILLYRPKLPYCSIFLSKKPSILPSRYRILVESGQTHSTNSDAEQFPWKKWILEPHCVIQAFRTSTCGQPWHITVPTWPLFFTKITPWAHIKKIPGNFLQYPSVSQDPKKPDPKLRCRQINARRPQRRLRMDNSRDIGT